MHDYNPRRWSAEGEYLPPEPPKRNVLRGAGAAAVGIGVLFAKFKGLFLILLNLKWFFVGLKFLASGASMLLSVWFYALFFGWPFAVVFVLLIFVHELGHAATMRLYGVPASLPFFIPGLGAFINMRGTPPSALHEAYIALAGPLVGTLASLLCFLYGEGTQSHFWIAAAYTGFFLNLFNLFPVLPLDGGRVAGAISPRIWLIGIVALVVAAIAFHWWRNPFIFILVLLSIPQAIAAWKGTLDTNYYRLTFGQRTGIALAYFSLAAFTAAAMLASNVVVPR